MFDENLMRERMPLKLAIGTHSDDYKDNSRSKVQMVTLRIDP